MDDTVFCVQLWVHNIEYIKTLPSIYFWTNFNNLHTILTHLTILISIKNQNSTTPARLVSFLKYATQIGSSLVNFVRFGRFAPHFDELSFESGPVFEIKIGLS
jgi:hypothetical protein